MTKELSGWDCLVASKEEMWGHSLTIEALERALERAKNSAHKERVRIVSWERYKAAQEAEADGATPTQIEQVLVGYSWADLKKDATL